MQTELLKRVMKINMGDGLRIHHLFKVWAFSKMIGTEEGLDEKSLLVLETAAIVHDIGIRSAIEKYGKYAGHIHEEEGVLVARPILQELGFDELLIEQVLHLVNIHQTKLEAESTEHQILLEADFLANSYEKGLKEDAIVEYARKVFKTETGRRMLALQSGILYEALQNERKIAIL